MQGQHLPAGDGGPAEMQDLLRIFVSLAACDSRDAALFQPLMAAAVALLPDNRAAAAAEPTLEALAAAEAAQGEWRKGHHAPDLLVAAVCLLTSGLPVSKLSRMRYKET